MTTETIDRAEVFSRPSAQFDGDGNIEVRASAALGCRRSLWYAATGYEPTNPPSEESLTAMEAGNALEPVVARAMERAGWQVNAADPQDPQTTTVRIGPNLLVTGHPDGTARMPLAEDEAPPQLFLFDGEPQAPAFGDPMVVEIKTRGPEAFKRWRTLGAERSHPASVAQAAFYTLGEFGDPAGRRDRHDGHGQQDLGLRGHSGPPAGAGLAGRLRLARRGGQPPFAQRAGPGRSAGPGLLRHKLAMPVVPVPGGLPAGCG